MTATATAGAPPRLSVTLATRGSKLALWQADHVSARLGRAGVTATLLVVKTTADRIQDRFLHELGGKGLFIKELEEALVSGQADLAVHSLKDMPAAVPAPFALAAVMARHSPCDAMIFRADVAARLAPPAALSAADVRSLGPLTVGTGSLRRQAILAGAAPALRAVGVRGNVDTRLAKLAAGEWDALILAEASLDRLGFHDIARCRLKPDWFIPSAAQGALAIETRAGDALAPWLAALLGDPETTLAVGIERALLARLGGDCNLPFGCHVAPDAHGRLVARAAVYGRTGSAAVATHAAPYVGPAGFAAAPFLAELARGLAAAGAAAVLAELGLSPPPGAF